MSVDEWCVRWNVPREALNELVTVNLSRDSNVEGSESGVQSAIRLAAGRWRIPLWRNNSGAYPDPTGRWIRYGLANDSERINKLLKSSDLIGIAPGGRFLAIETKEPGWTKIRNERDAAQAAYIALVRSAGGIAGFATSVEDFHAIVSRG